MEVQGTCPSRLPGCVGEKPSATRRQPMQPPRPVNVSGITFALLPLGFKRQNLLPVATLDLWNIRLLGNRGAPAYRIADQGLILGPHGHGAVGAEWRFDRQTAHGICDLLAISGIGLLGGLS